MNAVNNYNFSDEQLSKAESLFAENEKLVYFSIEKFRGKAGLTDEDLIQECKLVLWKACLTYNGETAKFSTYAVNCIHNQIVHLVVHENRDKRRNYQTAISMDSTIIIEDPKSPNNDTPLSEAIIDRGHETINLFDKYEDIFTPRQMKIFNWRLEGLTLAQIGKKLGVSHSAIGYELQKMKKKWEDNHINFGGATY